MRNQESIGFMIKQINNEFEKNYNNRLKALGITASQSAVLNYLFHSNKEENSQRDIEHHLNLKNPTVTGLLKRLDEKGFILCVPNASDRRRHNVYLTEKAYDIQKRLEADRRKSDRQLTLGMTKKEVEALQKVLHKVLENVSE